MNKKFDVIVIGAGPIGSYTAYQLADKGFAVCLLEKKKRVGQGVLCAGVISKEAFLRYVLPEESILTRIKSFTFISPDGQRLEYNQPSPFAYVVDRRIFDKGLFELARKAGVVAHLEQTVRAIKESSNSYTIISDKKEYTTKAVVLATGVNYRLQGLAGLGKPPSFLYGSQVELPVTTSVSDIEIHIGHKVAPGSFGWVVPINYKTSRVGVIVENNAKHWLRQMIRERLNIRHPYKNALRVKPIAYGPIRRSVQKNILAVGEAAGQIKTTTGGGIFYGLICSEIAVDKLTKMLHNGDSLSDYEITWRSALISEFDVGQRLRKVARLLDDKTIEKLFEFVKRNRFWVQLLLPRINFDYHSNMLSFCLSSFRYIFKLPAR